jgi:hypothetical protein
MVKESQLKVEIAEFKCEGLPGAYSTIWCLCYKTNKLKKRKEKRTTGRAK